MKDSNGKDSKKVSCLNLHPATQIRDVFYNVFLPLLVWSEKARRDASGITLLRTENKVFGRE